MLETEMNVDFQPQLTLLKSITVKNIVRYLFCTSPTAIIPKANQLFIEEGMFVDAEELHALATEMPSLISPTLLWALQFIKLPKVLFQSVTY